MNGLYMEMQQIKGTTTTKELCTLFNFKLTAGSHETLHFTQDCQSKDQQTLDHSRPAQTHQEKRQDIQEDEEVRMTGTER